MSVLIVIAALVFLMLAAYRGHSVILFAPIAALSAVLLTDPVLVAPMFTGVFMEKTVSFLKLYFPVFLLGAVFGKVVEMSGFSKAIVSAVLRIAGRKHALLAIVLVCSLMTYGGISLFVVVFAVYPFAAETFLRLGFPKRLIPATIALGAFTFTMDSLPGTPQIQNIIPVTFFKTNIYAAPWLGCIGALFILMVGLTYLQWRCRSAACLGEVLRGDLAQESVQSSICEKQQIHPMIALGPLILVGIMNKVFTVSIPKLYGESYSFTPPLVGHTSPVTHEISKVASIWAVEGALLCGIFLVMLLAWKRLSKSFADGSKAAVSGALLASMNTASEYGFGAVIAALPGFLVVADILKSIPHPLLNEALTVTLLAGITGSASGGLSIALAAMGETYIQSAQLAGIPAEVMHRIAAMASGGMDTLPHNGAVITLLTVTGLTHREAYGDIFAITLIKTMAVIVVIAVYLVTGVV